MSVNALPRYINNDTLKKTVPQIFNEYDRDKSKYLDKYEFRNLVYGSAAKVFAPFISDKDCDDFFNRLSKNGKVTLDNINSYLNNEYDISYSDLKTDSLKVAIDKKKTQARKRAISGSENERVVDALQHGFSSVCSTFMNILGF